jgi:formiminotetrahydrofolate cyclodeaminase
MAAALTLMVARLTIGKKKYADVEAQMLSIEQQASQLSEELIQAVSEDADAFQAVMEAFRLPKDTQAEKDHRADRIQSATLNAAQVPLDVARKAVELLSLAQQLVQNGNMNAISDAGSAAALAGAALTSAGLNVRINAIALKDKLTASSLIQEIDELENQGGVLQDQIRSVLHKRGGFSSE